MSRTSCWSVLASICFGLSLAASQTASAVLDSQVDDFGDGTTQGWIHGIDSEFAPANIPTGGPQGADDAFMRFSSAGTGSIGSRLVALNRSQWASQNYHDANISAFNLDVRNSGSQDIQLRIALHTSNFEYFVTSEAVFLPAENVWTNVTIPFSATDIQAVFGASDSPEEALSNPRELRLLSNSSDPPTHQGDLLIGGQLDVDNITAIAIPEPGSLALATLSGLALLFVSRRLR